MIVAGILDIENRERIIETQYCRIYLATLIARNQRIPYIIKGIEIGDGIIVGGEDKCSA